MKRCPKCNRTYPDDNQKFCTFDGGLLAADQPFDPNVTIQSTSGLGTHTPPEKPTSRELPDLNKTVASSQTAPTEVFHKQTGPTGGATVFEPRTAPPPQQPSAPLPRASQSAPLPATPSDTAPRKKSKLPMILGILALLLVLGVGAVVAAFFLVIKPRMDQTSPERSTVVVTNDNENTATNENVNAAEAPKTTDEFVPPSGAVKFTNSQANLDGKLAEHYVDFSFYYPGTWQTDPRAGVQGASNFAKVERRLPPDFTQENFAVGWYTSKGTFEADESTFPQLVEILGSSLAKGFPEYQKVSEGPTKINSLDGYEFRFVSVSKGTEKGDIQLWGRVVFLPTGVSGDQTGATLIMLATSLAPELSGVQHVGEKGEMPVILESFRFGRNR
jgi:hypothetical protein